MKRKIFTIAGVLALLALMVLAGCSTEDDGEEELLEVTHVNGFQGRLSTGSLIEIEVKNITDGDQSFTLYIDGERKGTGTLTLSGGSITAIKSSPGSSLTYSDGIRYGGNTIEIRRADDKVWVHWAVYAGATMVDFNIFAQQHNRDADRMYHNHPYPDEEGYYYGSPSYPSYDTPQNIYNQARKEHPSDAPPISVLNQAIRVLNDHRNTGVGAYVSRGNLIAYYFIRVK